LKRSHAGAFGVSVVESMMCMSQPGESPRMSNNDLQFLSFDIWVWIWLCIWIWTCTHRGSSLAFVVLGGGEPPML